MIVTLIVAFTQSRLGRCFCRRRIGLRRLSIRSPSVVTVSVHPRRCSRADFCAQIDGTVTFAGDDDVLELLSRNVAANAPKGVARVEKLVWGGAPTRRDRSRYTPGSSPRERRGVQERSGQVAPIGEDHARSFWAAHAGGGGERAEVPGASPDGGGRDFRGGDDGGFHPERGADDGVAPGFQANGRRKLRGAPVSKETRIDRARAREPAGDEEAARERKRKREGEGEEIRRGGRRRRRRRRNRRETSGGGVTSTPGSRKNGRHAR